MTSSSRDFSYDSRFLASVTLSLSLDLILDAVSLWVLCVHVSGFHFFVIRGLTDECDRFKFVGLAKI